MSATQTNGIYHSAIVGMGRTGTTIVREILTYIYETNNVKVNNSYHMGALVYSHFRKHKEIDFDNKIIICKRDLRDVLASNFRSVSIPEARAYNDKLFILENLNNYPSNYKIYKEKYGVSSEHILKEGKKLIQEGWNQWIDHVDYIFCYEDYMKNPKQIIQELADLVNCKNINIEKAINVTLEWKQKHPAHISNNGQINSWHDIFSEAQEKLILDNFGEWMKEQGYI